MSLRRLLSLVCWGQRTRGICARVAQIPFLLSLACVLALGACNDSAPQFFGGLDGDVLPIWGGCPESSDPSSPLPQELPSR